MLDDELNGLLEVGFGDSTTWENNYEYKCLYQGAKSSFLFTFMDPKVIIPHRLQSEGQKRLLKVEERVRRPRSVAMP